MVEWGVSVFQVSNVANVERSSGQYWRRHGGKLCDITSSPCDRLPSHTGHASTVCLGRTNNLRLCWKLKQVTLLV